MRPAPAFAGLLAAACLAPAPAWADVKLPAIFGDGMVLQQGIEVPVWGWADEGESVAVSFGGQQVSATTKDGKWQARLQPLKAGDAPGALTVKGKNTIEIKDVLVGEVWICSGQSNMEMHVASAGHAQEEIAAADFPKIRLFTVKKVVAAEPQRDVEGRWEACSPKTAGAFSAVGYFFGRDLHKTLGVPVGLIHTSWGGTPAEAWTSRPTLEADPALKPYVEQWDKMVAGHPNAKEEYEKQLAGWQKAADRAKAEGKKEPKKPQPPAGPDHPHRAAGLYNGMLVPLAPYAIRGAIWYQGESNAGRAYNYRTLFPTMIKDWRRTWGELARRSPEGEGGGDFPFLFVQLANYTDVKPEPGESDWAELREAQTMTLALPKTGMAVIIDIGEAKDIHPKNKQDVGHRLALAAQSVAYGKDLVYSGPIYESMKTEGGKVRLGFKHVGGGLEAKGGEALKGFAIAGSDRKFVWAEAKVEGNEVVVRSDKVPQPAAVRYAWANNPVCNLFNKEGLPASPFRTDDWPGVTQPK